MNRNLLVRFLPLEIHIEIYTAYSLNWVCVAPKGLQGDTILFAPTPNFHQKIIIPFYSI